MSNPHDENTGQLEQDNTLVLSDSVLGDGGCLFPDRCCMPGIHYTNECHTAEDLMAQEAESWQSERASLLAKIEEAKAELENLDRGRIEDHKEIAALKAEVEKLRGNQWENWNRDGKPKYGAMVRVKTINEYHYNAQFNHGEGWRSKDGLKLSGVIAWQPLPAPSKEARL